MESRLARNPRRNHSFVHSRLHQLQIFIKYYIVIFSLVTTFSMGYLQHSNNHHTKYLFEIYLMTIFSMFLFIFKLQKLLFKLSLLIIIIIWTPSIQWLLKTFINILFMVLTVIVYGQFQENSGKWIFCFFLTRFGGWKLRQIVNLQKQNIAMNFMFAIISIMSLYLLTLGLKYTKSEHPLPITTNGYIQYIPILGKFIWYILLFILISLGINQSDINEFSFDFLESLAIVLPLFLHIFVLNLPNYSYILLIVAIILSITEEIEKYNRLYNFGLIETIKIILSLQAMKIDRRLGSIIYLISHYVGIAISTYLMQKEYAYNILSINGMGLALILIMLRKWNINRFERQNVNQII